jgi:hypothetical protein
MKAITIINKHHKKGSGEYIGRGSPLGNPFPITKELPRLKAIAQYKTWLYAKVTEGDVRVSNELMRLILLARKQPIALECFCAPQPCHGEIIRDLLIHLEPSVVKP